MKLLFVFVVTDFGSSCTLVVDSLQRDNCDKVRLVWNNL